MEGIYKIDVEIYNRINEQIKQQKKNLLLAPLIFVFVLFLAYGRNGGKMPEYYFYIICIPLYVYGLFYPVKQGLLLGKTCHEIQILDDGTIQFITFGSLWRKEKIIYASSDNFYLNQTPEVKLLNNKYQVNKIEILGVNYYIFNILLKFLNV